MPCGAFPSAAAWIGLQNGRQRFHTHPPPSWQFATGSFHLLHFTVVEDSWRLVSLPLCVRSSVNICGTRGTPIMKYMWSWKIFIALPLPIGRVKHNLSREGHCVSVRQRGGYCQESVQRKFDRSAVCMKFLLLPLHRVVIRLTHCWTALTPTVTWPDTNVNKNRLLTFSS